MLRIGKLSAGLRIETFVSERTVAANQCCMVASSLDWSRPDECRDRSRGMGATAHAIGC